MATKVRIKKNDIVKVIAGKERGKKGKVLSVFPDEGRLIIEKLNMVKRHTKPNKKMQEGGIIEKEAKVQLSNVMVVCPTCDKAVRTSAKSLENGKKVRVCKKCGEMIGLE